MTAESGRRISLGFWLAMAGLLAAPIMAPPATAAPHGHQERQEREREQLDREQEKRDHEQELRDRDRKNVTANKSGRTARRSSMTTARKRSTKGAGSKPKRNSVNWPK